MNIELFSSFLKIYGTPPPKRMATSSPNRVAGGPIPIRPFDVTKKDLWKQKF